MIFEIDTTRKRETIDITERVRQIVRSAKPKLERGLCHVMVLHATAAIVVNENDDPNIGVDLLTALPDQVVASHVASLTPGRTLVDVGSSDRHVVKPWFAGRTEFAPWVRDLSGDGFELVGGRLDRVGDREAAAVVYRIRNHYVNLFMWRALSGQADPMKVSQARGFELATW